jgi:hypothetical protein
MDYVNLPDDFDPYENFRNDNSEKNEEFDFEARERLEEGFISPDILNLLKKNPK